MTNETPGAQAPSTAERDVEVLIAEGLKRHGYRQGTKECIAFFRGASYADETPLPAAGSGALIDALREAEAGLEFAGADRVEVGGFVPAPTKALAIVRGALRLAAPSMGGAETAIHVACLQCDDCQHVGINDARVGAAGCNSCSWCGPSPKEDRCPGCDKIGTMCSACPVCGGRYVCLTECQVASSAPAQAVETAGVREALDAYKLVSLWFDEWELILPPDARQSFIDDLMLSVRRAALQSPAASPASKEDGSHE